VEGQEHRTGRRRRRRRRSHYDEALKNWAKEGEPEGDEQEEANVGIVVAVAVGLVLVPCLYFILSQMDYAAPF
jgi:hypothetical protein